MREYVELLLKFQAALNESDPHKKEQMIQEITKHPHFDEFKAIVQEAWARVVEEVKPLATQYIRAHKKSQRVISSRRQRIKHKRWCY